MKTSDNIREMVDLGLNAIMDKNQSLDLKLKHHALFGLSSMVVQGREGKTL